MRRDLGAEDSADIRAHDQNAAQEQRLEIVVCWVCTGRGFLFHAAAEIVREDPRTDLALLRLIGAEEFPKPLSLDSLTSLSPTRAMPGDFIYFDAFRSRPSGEFEIRRVYGRVKRSDVIRHNGIEQRLLALDAKAWHGSSGSPVFSASGYVIGVLTNVYRENSEGLARDVPWVWELFGRSAGTQRTPAAAVITFPAVPAPVFAPYGNAEPVRWWTWWQRVRATLSRMGKTSVARD